MISTLPLGQDLAINRTLIKFCIVAGKIFYTGDLRGTIAVLASTSPLTVEHNQTTKNQSGIRKLKKFSSCYLKLQCTMRLYGVSMVLFILYLQILAVSLSAQARRTKKPKCRRGQSPELDGCVRRKGRSKANPTTSANEVNVPSMEPPRGPHCPPCSEISCFPLQQHECEGGLTTGYCGCCSVCAKLEGEKCGGRHYHFGKCDKNLECYQPTSLERRRSLGTPRIVVPSGTNVEESEVNESEGTCRPGKRNS